MAATRQRGDPPRRRAAHQPGAGEGLATEAELRVGASSGAVRRTPTATPQGRRGDAARGRGTLLADLAATEAGDSEGMRRAARGTVLVACDGGWRLAG